MDASTITLFTDKLIMKSLNLWLNIFLYDWPPWPRRRHALNEFVFEKQEQKDLKWSSRFQKKKDFFVSRERTTLCEKGKKVVCERVRNRERR
jgi:hypothetical protein